MVKNKEEKVAVCKYCKHDIKFFERHVLLGTYEGDKTINETWFHMQCFRKWYDEKVKEKATNIVQVMQKKAVGLLGQIQGMVGNFTGSDQLQQMLNVDLDAVKKETNDAQDIVDEVEKEEEKKHGRKNI